MFSNCTLRAIDVPQLQYFLTPHLQDKAAKSFSITKHLPLHTPQQKYSLKYLHIVSDVCRPTYMRYMLTYIYDE